MMAYMVWATEPIQLTVLPETVVKVGEPNKVPPIFKIPEPLKVIREPVVPVVIVLETVNVPVVILIISFLPIVVALMVSVPQINVPAFTFTVQL